MCSSDQQDVFDPKIWCPILFQCVHTYLSSGTNLKYMFQQTCLKWSCFLRWGGRSSWGRSPWEVRLGSPLREPTWYGIGRLRGQVSHMGISSFLCNVEHEWPLITSIRCARRPIYNCLNICQVIFVHLRRKSLIPILKNLLQPQYWSPPFSPEPRCAPKGILWRCYTVQAKCC